MPLDSVRCTMYQQEFIEEAIMWLEDITDPDTSDLIEAREEFAGWDPYIIQLCRQALVTDADTESDRSVA